MHHHELFHLDRSIGLFSVDEIARNLKDNRAWVNAVDERGDTPLHIAARDNSVAHVRKMLPHYSRVDAVNDHGDTLLHLFVDNCTSESDAKKPSIRGLISRCARFDERHRVIRSLVARGADVNLKNHQGVTAARLAAEHGHADVLRIFQSGKRELCVRLEDGDENLLHLVFKNRKSAYKDTSLELKVASYLMKQGCDANAVDREGNSALHYALLNRGERTARRLVRRAFDIRRWTDEKALSRHLLTASAACDPSVMRFLIERGAADANFKDAATGKTPLHFAAESRSSKQYEAMEVLLKSGAHVDVKDHSGRLPLDYALLSENVRGLECLMEFGVDVVHTPSFRRLGETPTGQLEAFLLRHLTKLKAVGLRVDEACEARLRANDWQIYRRICLEEAKEMKLCMVDDDTSLYDLLRMKTRHCRYAHLPKLLRNLKSSFPIYYGIIRIRIHEIERKSLIAPATAAWYELTNVQLPYVCVENILSHLSSCCLRTMIDGKEDGIVYNSVLLQAKWLEE